VSANTGFRAWRNGLASVLVFCISCGRRFSVLGNRDGMLCLCTCAQRCHLPTIGLGAEVFVPPDGDALLDKPPARPRVGETRPERTPLRSLDRNLDFEVGRITADIITSGDGLWSFRQLSGGNGAWIARCNKCGETVTVTGRPGGAVLCPRSCGNAPGHLPGGEPERAAPPKSVSRRALGGARARRRVPAAQRDYSAPRRRPQHPKRKNRVRK
jgi:ribosomal protein S27E